MHKAQDVQWIVCRDDGQKGELGVRIGDQIFALYKGESREVYGGSWRRVSKREFGEALETDEDPEQYDWNPISGHEIYFHCLESLDEVCEDDDRIYVTLNEGASTILMMVDPKNKMFKINSIVAGAWPDLIKVMHRADAFLRSNNL